MGCDIHLYTEAKKSNGKWCCSDYFKLNEESYIHIPIYHDRNYALFATLADVRNYSDIEPIDSPRGLPENLSNTVKKELDLWTYDRHSYSWFTAKELFIHKNKHPFTKYSGMISPDAQIKLDEYGIIPTEWCIETNQEGWERQEWILPNSILDNLIEAIKRRMCEEFRIYDFLDPKEKEKKIWKERMTLELFFLL